ncbi:MAG: hypothetical protein JWM27_3355 [Gemmatimonadetes bacterium]|nr:hypothetical protein [Gemmatimonadota bacterium]
MVRAPRIPRLFRLLLAVLQLALSGAAVVADGRQEAEAARATVHVEGHTDRSCPVPHAADCPICQFLQSPASTSHADLAMLPPAREEHVSPWAIVSHRGTWTARSPLARPPPALS